MTEQLLLTAVERRFDDRLDGLAKLLDQSLKSMQDLYEEKLDNLEAKIDSLQESVSHKEYEAKQNKLTLWLALGGWFVTTIVGLINWVHPIIHISQ